MKCPNCHGNAVYQLDDPRGSIVCVSCGAIASWTYRYRTQVADQSVADQAALAQLEIDLLRAKMAGKLPLDKSGGVEL